MFGLSPQVTNLVIMLGMMQVSKKIPFEDPQVLLLVRAVYLLSNFIILTVNLYIRSKINQKNDMTTLEYVEPAMMGSGEPPKHVVTTVHKYDLEQLQAAFKGQMTGVGMMAVMHLYFKFTNPLLVQSIIPLKGVFENNLAKVYLLGQPAVGDLARPWKSSANFMGMNSGNDIKTDKKSIEEAKKANRGGAKEE